MKPDSENFDEMISTAVIEWSPPQPKITNSIPNDLSEAGIGLLKVIIRTPHCYATQYYDEANLCASTAVKVQQELIKKGYLIPKRLDTGRRGAKPLMLILTNKAKDFLRSIGEPVKGGSGRGAGPTHDFFRFADNGVFQDA